MVISIRNISKNATEVRAGSMLILFSSERPVAAKNGGRRFVISGDLTSSESKHIGAWLGYTADPEYVSADFMDKLLTF
jgi:hypothetical protein